MLVEKVVDELFESGSPLFAPSDKLPELKAIASNMAVLKNEKENFKTYRLIIDANAVLAELRWQAMKRKDKNARSALSEAVDSGSIELYAPSWLKKEVCKHLKTLSDRYHIELKELRQLWLAFQEKIRFCAVKKRLENKYRREGDDVKDAPYIALAEQMGGIKILSADTDIRRMGGKALDPVVLTPKLRDSARSMAVWLHCKNQANLLAFLSAATIIGAITIAVKLVKRIPPWLQMLSLIASVFAIWICYKNTSAENKKSDKKRNKWWVNIFNLFCEVGIRLLKRKELAYKQLALVEAEIAEFPIVSDVPPSKSF